MLLNYTSKVYVRSTYTTDTPHSLRDQVGSSKEQEKELGIPEKVLKRGDQKIPNSEEKRGIFKFLDEQIRQISLTRNMRKRNSAIDIFLHKIFLDINVASFLGDGALAPVHSTAVVIVDGDKRRESEAKMTEENTEVHNSLDSVICSSDLSFTGAEGSERLVLGPCHRAIAVH